ncbi:MAG: hypothetical protein PWP23_3122 [Candidatus Sumerlaeota bacterium]|nr:hypothetical protein [Candidatus Sumerlaeota bacterium]
MTSEAWITVTVISAVFGFLAFTRYSPDVVLLGGLVVLMLTGVLDTEAGLEGFSNKGPITVGVLFVVAAGIRDTGVVAAFVEKVLRRPKTLAAAQVRVMAPVAFLSAFMNNTPLVAMMVPALADWAKKMRLPVSKLMIPLSYAAILGGMCTLIGTSTNLLVDGMVQKAAIPGYARMGFFDIAYAGVPVALVAIAFILVSSRWLLPDRTPPVDAQADPREYVLEMLVEPGSPLCGRTIEEAGLRHLQGVYLMEIDREGHVLPAVASTERLRADDRLIFVGIVDSVVDLQKIRGLKPATNQTFKINAPDSQRALFEAVVSHSSPMIGKSIREGRFRARYDAAVIAVARDGERIRMKMGDIVMQPGDTVLLEAHPIFLDRMRNSRDFYLISRVEDYTPPRYDRAWVAVLILGGMVAAATLFNVDMLMASMVAAALMVMTKCCSAENARRSIDWRVLLAICAALGLGEALKSSGAAAVIAKGFIGLAGDHPFLALAAIYILTSFFTEIITNNAAAVLIFPIALATASGLGVSPQPFIISIMIAASASLATPIGYQTNLMVYGPGGYRFSDFLKIGIPANIVIFVTAMIVVPLVFPL